MPKPSNALRATTGAGSYARGVALLDRYDRMLAPFGGHLFSTDIERADLIPLPDLAPIIAALENQLLPADTREVAETIAMVAGAWPYAHLKADAAALDLHVGQMSEDLAEFPPDVLRSTVRELRRTLRFAPSLSELYQTALEMADARRRRLRTAHAHLREHGRREALEQAEREGREAKRVAFQAQLDRLTAAHPGAFTDWSAADLEAVDIGWVYVIFKFPASLNYVLGSTESWVPSLLAAVSVAGRALPHYREHKLSARQICPAIQLAPRDFKAARQTIIDAIGAIASAGSGNDQDPPPPARRARAAREPDDGMTWTEPTRLLLEVIEGLSAQRQPEGAA
jgi:hypothetical protein